MSLKRCLAGCAALFLLCLPAAADMYSIQNPAGKINNPADKMYNPATQVNNPAANIYNPASRMLGPDPLSPPTQPLVTEAAPTARPEKRGKDQQRLKPVIPRKSYYYKTVGKYISSAKKAFTRDDYTEFLAITEDALRRIHAGTLKASTKTRQKLVNYRKFGYGLLEAAGE